MKTPLADFIAAARARSGHPTPETIAAVLQDSIISGVLEGGEPLRQAVVEIRGLGADAGQGDPAGLTGAPQYHEGSKDIGYDELVKIGRARVQDRHSIDQLPALFVGS